MRTAASLRPPRNKAAQSKHKQGRSHDLAQVPPLPQIPETLRAAKARSKFESFRKRVKAPQQSGAIVNTARDMSHKPAGSSSDVKVPRRHRRGKVSLRSQISEPTLHSTAMGFPLSAMTCMTRNADVRRLSDGSAQSPTLGNASLDIGTDCRPREKHVFWLAPPRLSPMEITREHLIRKARAQKVRGMCHVPKLEHRWYWTPGWEKFLILPRAPSTTQHCDVSRELMRVEEQDANLPALESLNPPRGKYASDECPRLSLHLGGINTLMPSFTNLASLVKDKAAVPRELAPLSMSGAMRFRSRRLSSNPEGKRGSLTTVVEAAAWAPQSHHTRDASEDTATGTVAHDEFCFPSRHALAGQHGVLGAPGNVHERDRLVGAHHLLASYKCNLSATPRQVSDSWSFDSSSSLTETLMPPTGRGRPLRVDPDLTAGRIQSMAGSILTCTTSEGSRVVGSRPEHASGILFTPVEARGRESESVSASRRRDARPSSGLRRHSFHAKTPPSVGSRDGSPASSQRYEGPFASTQGVPQRYFNTDSLTNRHRDNVYPLPLRHDSDRQLPSIAIPDSPTLGQEAAPLIRDSYSIANQIESLELPEPSASFRGGRGEASRSQGADTRPLHQNRATATKGKSPPAPKRGMLRRGASGHGACSSSFALNKAKSHDAFTLLPRLSPGRGAELGSDTDMRSRLSPCFNPAVGAPTTATALQALDTASRLASVMNRDKTVAPANLVKLATADESFRKMATFSGLFSRHVRRSSCGSPNLSSSSRASDSVAMPSRSREGGSEHGDNPEHEKSRDQGLSHSPPQLTRQQQRRAVSGGSHSSTSGTFVGLKDRFKLKKKVSRV